MGKASAFAYLALAAPLVLAGCDQPPAQEPAPTEAPADMAATTESPLLTADATDEQIIASAESAAPADVGREATIVAMGADGMREVRKGSNIWTCMADNPATPGADPMCGDPNAMEWVQAWVNKTPPPEGKVGFMYMLAGGADASNTDPNLTEPAEGRDWLKVGPHVMVVGARGLMEGYPAGEDPDLTKPFVMWAGTPYEHLMIPV